MLVQDLRPRNVKTYLEVMSVIDKQYLMNFVGIFSDCIENNLLAECFDINDWKEILELVSNCIVEEKDQSVIDGLRNLVKNQIEITSKYDSFIKENKIDLNAPVNIAKPQ